MPRSATGSRARLELRGFIVTAVGSVAEALPRRRAHRLRRARPQVGRRQRTGTRGSAAPGAARHPHRRADRLRQHRHRRRAVKEGAVDYLAKPADADAIEQALTAHGRKLRRRPAIRCRLTACAGSTSSASSNSATATSRRRRAVSTCIAAPCSASWASTPPANTDARALITVQLLLNATALGMAYALVALASSWR